MTNELLIALTAGLGGMVGWGFADFFVKKTVDQVGSIISLVWAHLFGSLALISIAIIQFFLTGRLISIPSSSSEWLGLIFFGILQMVVYWLVYEAFGKGKLAVLNPIFASFAGFVAIISVVFLGEMVSSSLATALVIIFSGVLILNLDIDGLKIKGFDFVAGLKEILLATLLATVWTVGWSIFVAGKDFLSYALFMYVFMTVAAYVLSILMKAKLTITKQNTNLWKFMVLIGVSEIIAYIAISYGYSATTFTSVVALISGAFSLPTILLSHMFLDEKVTKIQTIGSLVIVAGIVLLALR